MSAEDAISQIHSWKLYRLKWPGSPKEKVQRKERKWGAGRHQRVEHSATSGYAETPDIHWTSLSIRMAVDAQNFFHIN